MRRSSAASSVFFLAAVTATLPLAAQAPPNSPAVVYFDGDAASLQLTYDGHLLLDATLEVLHDGGDARPARRGELGGTDETDPAPKVEQRIGFTLADAPPGSSLRLRGTCHASDEALAAELRGAPQARFPLLRTSDGRSDNRRNHAVYDRRYDWLLAGPDDGRTRIEPDADGSWRITCTGPRIELVFRPRFYQQHKNLPWFEPWTYRVYRDSVSGWCSWWAYRDAFDQTQLDSVVAALARHRLADFGYRWIQIDDCYQTSMGMPDGWLHWNPTKFPRGAAGAVAAIRGGGFEPGIWVYSAFHDQDTVAQHPDWFVHDAAGKPFEGPWVGFGVDGTNAKALDAIVLPTQRGFADLGCTYVKVDSLRHLLYDSYHHALPCLAGEHSDPARAFRSYLAAARSGMRPDAFLLACWGVLPEAIGIADGCRLGTDGFGPACLQQYNSWNGIVWRNDPDHCDVLPRWNELRDGKLDAAAAARARRDAILRPCLTSMGGGVLMLSDRAEVYADAANVEGIQRAAPVPFSVPGQLYDFDPKKSDRLAAMARTDILTGSGPSPVDADQTGEVCPWWLLEVERPFARWDVLAHFQCADVDAPAQTVAFADLGLPADQDVLVYEFWSRRFLGAARGSFEAPALPAHGTQVFALRPKLDRPQLLSTTRHITQGGVDLVALAWDPTSLTLSGRSRVIAQDRYEITAHLPPGYEALDAAMAGHRVDVHCDGELALFACTPDATATIDWSLRCRRQQ